MSRSCSGATGWSEVCGITSPPSVMSHPWLVIVFAPAGGVALSAAFHNCICRCARSPWRARLLSVGGNFFRGGGFFLLLKMLYLASFMDDAFGWPYSCKKKGRVACWISVGVASPSPRTVTNSGMLIFSFSFGEYISSKVSDRWEQMLKEFTQAASRLYPAWCTSAHQTGLKVRLSCHQNAYTRELWPAAPSWHHLEGCSSRGGAMWSTWHSGDDLLRRSTSSSVEALPLEQVVTFMLWP